MGIRDAAPEEPLPTEWDLTYEPCPCGGTAQRFHHETRTFYQVPCTGKGQLVSWSCKMKHWHGEFAQGRDPVGKGGRPFRMSTAEGWTRIGALKESVDHARANGTELQRTSRS